MKRVHILIVLFLSVLAFACEPEVVFLPQESSSYHIQIHSKGLHQDNRLPQGSQILVNATGGLQITNEVFTFDGSTWENDNQYNWGDPQAETHITALHPVYEGHVYSVGNLYSSDGLEDVLICQQTFHKEDPIQLQFHHLFSLLSIHLETSILENLQEIQLTTPSKVDYISPIDGTFSTIDESHTTLLANNGTGDYSFVIPPSKECILTLTLLMKDGKTHTHPLNPHTFESGYRYDCNVIDADERPGIRSAADLIEFSQFINDPNNKGKIHPEFGEKIGEEIIYRLLDDITLTEGDCQSLAPIGDHSSTPFTNTFDGQGHTISNLILPDKNAYGKRTGLFGYISTNGIIKNLHVYNANSIDNPTCTYVGVIAANNEGLIDNCSVSNSSIKTTEQGTMGLICSVSTGHIINSYTINNNIHVEDIDIAGSITGSAEGYILNCYTSMNIFSCEGSGYKIGSITGNTTTHSLLTIENCFIYHKQESSNWGAALGHTENVLLRSFYYNIGKFYYTATGGNTKYEYNRKYDNNFKYNSIPISNYLNEWKDNTLATTYPNYTFRSWTTSENGSPCFQ